MIYNSDLLKQFVIDELAPAGIRSLWRPQDIDSELEVALLKSCKKSSWKRIRKEALLTYDPNFKTYVNLKTGWEREFECTAFDEGTVRYTVITNYDDSEVLDIEYTGD